MTNLTVRPAVPGDMDTVGRLGAMLVRTHYDFDAKRFIAPTENTPKGYANYLGTQLTNPKVFVIVAELDGIIAGYSYAGVEGFDYMELRGPAGVVYDILVDPQHRKRGIGRVLLDATLAALRERGASQVVLSTAEKNEEAQRLFERAGFRRTMIEMTKDLEPPSGQLL